MQVSSTSYHRSKHLEEQELRPEEGSCPWCGCVNRATIVSLQLNPLVTLEECPICFAVSASRMPTDAALSNYYDSYYRGDKFHQAGAKVTVGSPHRMGNHVAQWMVDRDRGGALRILDFGGGDGSVATNAAEILLNRQQSMRQLEIAVVDYNPKPVQLSSEAIRLQHYPELDDLPPGEFDFVIASAILEHIPAPSKVFDRLLGLVRHGGGFYARTPFVVPMLKLFRGIGVNMDFTFPAHLHDLGQSFWENQFALAACKSGFRVVASRPSIVETTFSNNFVRTLAAHLFKLPWFVFGRKWKLVGGWEVALERVNSQSSIKSPSTT